MQSIFMRARASLEAKGVFAHGAVPEAIANSWHRCLEYGLDPRSKPIDAAVSYQALREAKQEHEKLIAIVRPELELLSNQIAGTNYLTAFADSQGMILDAIMDNEFRDSECAQSVRPGSIWSEEVRGTNALGMALHTGETSMVTGKEHFYSKHGGVACISVPIFDSTGKIVGLLDASSEVAARQYHTQALVSLAATNIENRLFVDEHRGNNIVQFHPREEYLTTQSVGMISMDEDGRINGVNRYAGEILSGIDLSSIRTFSDLFQGGFGTHMGSMNRGKIIRLNDWLNSAYFARIRINHPKTGSKHSVALAVPPVYAMPELLSAPVFRDEQIFNSLRLAKRSARIGSPLLIIGDEGSGRTTFAQAIHEEIKKTQPLIFVDCQTANLLGEAEHLMADILAGSDTKEFSVETGGTLVLENLALVRGGAADKLAQVTNRLLQLNTQSNWVVIATGNADLMSNNEWSPHVKMAFSKLAQMKIHLPPLSDRTDFSLVASSILAKISPMHQLSNSAVSDLKKINRPQHLNDLANHIRILAVQCPIGIIREADVERYLVLANESNPVCPRCIGNSASSAKCREINRVFQQCNSNVSIAARKLGVSRNTVYSHIAEQSNNV